MSVDTSLTKENIDENLKGSGREFRRLTNLFIDIYKTVKWMAEDTEVVVGTNLRECYLVLRLYLNIIKSHLADLS